MSDVNDELLAAAVDDEPGFSQLQEACRSNGHAIAPRDIDPLNIPDALTSRAQWVNWNNEKRTGKETKVPYNAHRGQSAIDRIPERGHRSASR